MVQGKKNTPILNGLGYLFCVVSRQTSFFTISAALASGINITDSNLFRVLKGLLARFMGGVGCLYG
jgi:hypothetical protein